MVNNLIDWEVKKYTLPVYSYDYLENYDPSKIQFKIDKSTFFETLLLMIRGETVKYSSIKKRERINREQELIHNIEQLEPYHLDDEKMKVLEENKEELENLRKDELMVTWFTHMSNG